MRKYCIILTICLLLGLTGCQSNQEDKAKYDLYLTLYQNILETQISKKESEYFDVKIAVNKLTDGNYRYDIIIDNPTVGMYKIKALSIIDGLNATLDKNIMMPSVGIFDDDPYNLVPYQVDTSNFYYQGLVLSLISNKDKLKISTLVEWNNNNDSLTTREYLSIYSEYIEDAN